MAEIPVERKRSLMWLWVLLGIIVLALLVWWISDDDEPDVVEPVGTELAAGIDLEPVASAPGERGAEQPLTIANVLASPAAYVGRNDFTAEAAVPDVPADRGFWIEDQGQRLFAVLIDKPGEGPVDINPGQQLRLSQGMIRDSSFLPELPGRPIDPDTRRILGEQKVFLVVDEDNVEILSNKGPEAPQQ